MKRELPEGARVKFTHGRCLQPGGGPPVYWSKEDDPERVTWAELGNYVEPGKIVSPRGGATHCKITLPDGTEANGEARCSHSDNYSKRLGRTISLGRALADLERRTA